MVTTFEVLTTALEFDKARISKRDEMRVASILRSLGWKKTKATYLGKRQKVWVSEEVSPAPSHLSPPVTTSSVEVGQSEMPTTQGVNSGCHHLSPPFSQTLPTDSHHHHGGDQSPGESLVSEVGSGGVTSAEANQSNDSEDVPTSVPPTKHQPPIGDEVVTVDNQLEIVEGRLEIEIKHEPTDKGGGELDHGQSQPHERRSRVNLKSTTSNGQSVDYSTFPHLTSNDERAKEKRAKGVLF